MKESCEQVDIRALDGNDASAWWHLRLEALEREPTAFSASVEAHRRLLENEILARLTNDPENKFVIGVFVGGQLVGTAGFVREGGLKERHKGRIWGVYLSEQMRGKGIGRRMLQSLLDRVTGIDGVEQILLSVATEQIAAVALYRSLGFTSFGREVRALKVGDRYLDEEYMILRLR